MKTLKPATGKYLRDPETSLRDQVEAAVAARPGSFARDIAQALALAGEWKAIRYDVFAALRAVCQRRGISRTRDLDARTGKEAWRYYPAERTEP